MQGIKEKLNWVQPAILPKESLLRKFILLTSIILVNIIIIVELMASSISMSITQGYLAIDDTKTVWIDNTFLLFLGMSVPVAIYTSRKYGYKIMFFLGLSIFSTGCIFTGLSTSFYELIVFRALAGIGGGLVFPVSLAVIKRAFEGSLQRMALSIYVGVGFGGGFIIGALLGGFYGQALEWREVHYLCFSLAIPSLFLISAFMYETQKYPTHKFDFLTFICFAIFLVSTLTLLSQVKAPWNTEGFRSSLAWGCYISMFLSQVVMLIWYRYSKAPLFEISLFKNVNFCVACVCMAFVGVMFFGATLVVVSLMEKVFGYERLKIGYMIAIFGVSFVISGALSSALVRFINLYFVVALGLLALCVSSFLTHSLTLISSPNDIAILLILRGCGVGLSLGPLTAMALRNIPDDLTGQAAALATIFRQVGGAFGSSAISLVAVVRNAFHTARFGEQINPYSPQLQNYFRKLAFEVGKGESLEGLSSAEVSKSYFIENLKGQSLLLSFNDAFYLFGWIFIALILLVVTMALINKNKPFTLNK